MRLRDEPDSGAAVVWALALVTVLMLAGLLAAAVGQQALVRQRVATSADMAALAGAQSTEGDPCAEAQRLVTANDTKLIACAVDGVDIVVRVTRPAPSLVHRLYALLGTTPPDVVGVARAGPPGNSEEATP